MSATSTYPQVVSKSGEGYDRPSADQELPLDINYQKLSEWLVSRQKLPSDWHKRVQAIQLKITEAITELPAGLLAQLPGGVDAAVDYFRAVQIRDKLAETADMTLFGGLTGQAGIWDKIVKAYENGGVFIGEAAQNMVQNVDYEIPYLRKQMAKCNQQLADADRRHAEYTRGATTCANNFHKECEKLGITGASIPKELRQLSQKLPGMFQELVQELRSPALNKAIGYYQHFTQYAHGSEAGKTSAASANGQQQKELPHVLSVLQEIRARQTTSYTSVTASAAANNAAADSSALPSIDCGGLDVSAAADSSAIGAVDIDWAASSMGQDGAGTAAADADAGAAAAGGVSWDLVDVVSTAAATGADDTAAARGGISWDFEVEQPEGPESSSSAAAADGPALDWDIDLSGIGVEGSGETTAAGIDWGIDVGDAEEYKAAAAAADGAGAGSTGESAAEDSSSGDASADRLQHDSDYRSQLLDDLQELRAFLVSRRYGLSGSSSSSDLLRALAPDAVASTDAGDVKQMLSRVEQLLAALNDDKLRQLLMISSSSRYVERLQGSLQRKAGQEAKMLAAAAETQARKHESRATLVSLQPKLAEIVARTRSIKQAVEIALSKQFNGRRVNVLGEINNALTASA